MKIKNIISVLLCAAFIFGLAGWCFFGPKDTYSESERRALAKFPETSWDKISSGAFASEFEKYSTDVFPARDMWRSLKAYTRLGAFAQKENNDLYLSQGHLSQLQYPMKTEMLDYAIELLTKVRNQNFPDAKVYFSLVPDKNHVLADLKMDYSAFEDYMRQGLSFAEAIEIRDLLTAEDYYYTDTHWRQEKITDVADRLAQAMGTELPKDYEHKKLDVDFYGVYAGQSALNVNPDEMTVLTNETIEGMQVTMFTNQGTLKKMESVYDMSRLEGNDPYEMYLSGAQSVIKIQNPANTSGKRLIIFRDSFGSSITPLLAQGYSEVVMLDLRYIMSQALPMMNSFIQFENADVLFLYSSLVLNDALSMK